MRIRKYGQSTHIYTRFLHLQVLKSHINYYWEFKGEYYRLSIPFNPFNRNKYGMSISEDGTDRTARYYRPKREWGLVEPRNDPEYQKAVDESKEV